MAGYSSRWYFPFFEGLAEGKHRQAMGQALWLYLWMLGRAWVAQREGEFSYTHVEAARDLATSERSVHRWFRTLQEHGYIEIRVRRAYDLDVGICKWRTVEEWLESRAAGGGVGLGATREDKSGSPAKNGLPHGNGEDTREDKSGLPGERKDKREDTREDSSGLPPLILSTRLQGYSYPTGPAASRQDVPAEAVCLADLFHDLKAKLVTAKNRPAVLATIYRLCFGDAGENQPTFGYLGKVAQRVGGEGVLAELMWKLTATEPKTDPLAWIMQYQKQRQARGNGRGRGDQQLPDAEQFQRRADEQGGAIRRARILDEES